MGRAHRYSLKMHLLLGLLATATDAGNCDERVCFKRQLPFGVLPNEAKEVAEVGGEPWVVPEPPPIHGQVLGFRWYL